MTIAILFKSGQFKIYDYVCAVNMEDGRLIFTTDYKMPVTCITERLDEIAKVSVGGIMYYEDGKAKI